MMFIYLHDIYFASIFICIIGPHPPCPRLCLVPHDVHQDRRGEMQLIAFAYGRREGFYDGFMGFDGGFMRFSSDLILWDLMGWNYITWDRNKDV